MVFCGRFGFLDWVVRWFVCAFVCLNCFVLGLDFCFGFTGLSCLLCIYL